MDKKLIIGISTGACVVVFAMIGWLMFLVSSNTKDAKDAAAEFTVLLQEGEIETLRLEYYAYSAADNKVLTDENGKAQVQIVTKQQMAEMFGYDAVMDNGDTQGDGSEEALLKVIMQHTRLQANVNPAWGDTASMSLQMMIPDIKTWLLQLSEEELEFINAMEIEPLEDLTARLACGEIGQQYIQLKVPMIKQNGKWRSEVTEETEHVFFGGLYNLFDKEATEQLQ